jgi:hypothetical protein
VGASLAKALIAVRESSGNITREILEAICRRRFSPEILAMMDLRQNTSLSAEKTDKLGQSSLEVDTDEEEEDIQPSTHDWLEMVKVMKAATSVMASHKQQQLSSVCTLATDDKIFPDKNLKLMTPADFTAKTSKSTLTTTRLYHP